MSPDEVLLLFFSHEDDRVAAAMSMRVRRTVAQIVSCLPSVRAQVQWHICTHLHCYSFFQYREKKGFQSHVHFTVSLAKAKGRSSQ